MRSSRVTRGDDTVDPAQSHGQHSLTKRELLAAMAMVGRLANHDCSNDPAAVAVRAVEHADFLIDALNKEAPDAS